MLEALGKALDLDDFSRRIELLEWELARLEEELSNALDSCDRCATRDDIDDEENLP